MLGNNGGNGGTKCAGETGGESILISSQTAPGTWYLRMPSSRVMNPTRKYGGGVVPEFRTKYP
ncbi:MAG: hypothetical protein EBT47_11245 [Chloroflexi bacterium]|nr:hypothetical protein [Chloroflexota bacterium]